MGRAGSGRGAGARDPRAGTIRRVLAVVTLSITLAGCALVKVREESRAFYSSTVLVGRVSAAITWSGPIVVAAYSRSGLKSGARSRDRTTIAHCALLHEAGGFELIVPRGEYYLFAFGDANGNLTFDAGEPAGEYPSPGPIVATGTGVIASLDLVLANAAVGRPAIPVGTPFPFAGTRRPHSTQVGAIASLDEPEFSSASGRRAYWAPMEFFKESGGNIYFVEPYDPNKTPILFVHGAAGSPQDWRSFLDGIDRSRYQPWIFFYPSGAAVDSMAHLLFWKLLNLQLRYRFEKLYITAHSMGGLVVRTFLLNHGSQFPSVKLFLSLSTPWGGEASAEMGVKYSPGVIPSWNDMRPEGRFMKSLFTRRLPPELDYYLFFGYRGGYSLIRPNNDGTITLASQLMTPAQAEARMVYGFDEDHVSILSSPRVLAQYNAILDSVERTGAAAGPAGTLRLDFSFDGAAAGTRPLLVLLLHPVDAQRSKVTLVLSADDAGRVIGPIPAGDYEASLLADAFRTEPRKVRATIEPGVTPALSFHFIPQGALLGYVGADVDAADKPAGSYRAPHETVKISSITLTGSGERRTLVPRRQDGGEGLERYLAGQDDAYEAFFSFVSLPQGDYELTILADGYRPYTARHTVVPGRYGQLKPIELTPLRSR